MNAKLIAFVPPKNVVSADKVYRKGKSMRTGNAECSRTGHISGRVSRETLLGESCSSFFSSPLAQQHTENRVADTLELVFSPAQP